MKVYLDSVSTTAPDPEVLSTYEKILKEQYCNSDALYDDGVAIYNMQEKSREIIASLLKVKKDDILFTSGASEANSLAVKGLCLKHLNERPHIVTSSYEHSSIHNAMKQLEEDFGLDVTYIVPEEGIVTPEMVDKAIRKDTLLVSIMAVNNEIGALNDISAIAKTVKRHPGVYFHTDITQAIGKTDVVLDNVDMASFSAHKIHGLKGSGVLMKRKHIEILPLISGGQQEYSLRGGTSNAPANIVLAKTLRLSLENHEKYQGKMKEYREILTEGLSAIRGVSIHTPKSYIDTLISLSTPIPSEVLLNALNKKGIMVSSKSTCGSRKNEENRTMKAMGIDEDYVIRVSFDYTNTKEEYEYFLHSLRDIIEKYGNAVL